MLRLSAVVLRVGNIDPIFRLRQLVLSAIDLLELTYRVTEFELGSNQWTQLTCVVCSKFRGIEMQFYERRWNENRKQLFIG